MRHLAVLLVCSVLIVPSTAATQDHASMGHSPTLGRVNFRNSGNAAAQEPLQRGVAFLHSFMYPDAARAFREAQAADPSLASAYWLEALTYSHVVWGEENLERARGTLARLGPTVDARLAKAGTPRERAFGAAVEAYFMEAPLPMRTRAYSDSMYKLATADTLDLETSAFGAHAALITWFSAPPGQRGNLLDVTRSLALRVFNANQQHPGAAHYLTHVADMDPRSADKLLSFARAYDKIAPDADHALHMPSHVYLPLGLWRDVTAANERSWPAARVSAVRNGGSPAMMSWHSYEWLQYSYLQEGRWREARALIDTARAILAGFTARPEQPDARFALGVLAFKYGMETGDWSVWSAELPSPMAILALPTPTQRALAMTTFAAYHAAVAATLRGQRGVAEQTSARFRQVADTTQTPRKSLLLRLATQLDALNARTRGDLPAAITLLRSIDDAPESASTPPNVLPNDELLGDMLLAAKQPAEAAIAYRKALDARPNRSRSLLGLIRALRAAGDAGAANVAERQLRDNWLKADADVARLLPR